MQRKYEDEADALLGNIFESLTGAIDGLEKKSSVDLMNGATKTYLAAGELVRLLVEAGLVTDLAGFEELPPFFSEAVN